MNNDIYSRCVHTVCTVCVPSPHPFQLAPTAHCVHQIRVSIVSSENESSLQQTTYSVGIKRQGEVLQ